ncbi:Siphovirus Gp37-like protein [uncultured Caudovirales phage]|uniref:Siphovirus Gp37-like protein n=1 Tax=uncultured Caudovirales phage TaxID=2100421 RepID=A0A6J5SPR8_9CAUD|nr:Siphovirus Gp37-like protein [uncultured Caudovirales phage]CAB4167975.1 Siphovirus Gp37-like protein [uncultured Caudovirales phage]CAB4173766.1 Siphovirus Gp37-like protein [uncultured Caudovirales phage]CAB4180658.1 Siphovirus Gp37-like protein [uncultured Caudovirales phage]CAB4186344.1 Siphovirus Gp37-like protein [uncultured Caudovirales phage]
MVSYSVYIRDSTFALVAQISAYKNIKIVKRFNAVGSWALELEYSELVRPFLSLEYGIYIVRNDAVICSGPFGEITRKVSANENSVLLSGPDDNVYVQDRLILPNPNGPTGGSTGTFHEHYSGTSNTGFDVRTGPAETVIKEYVYYNLGEGAYTSASTNNYLPSSAKADRRLNNFTVVTTAGLGYTVTGLGRFQNLATFISDLAISNGNDLGWKVSQASSGLSFDVYQPTDKTATAKFAIEYGNLVSYDYVIRSPSSNYVFVGGAGDTTTRMFVEAKDNQSITAYKRRIENFYDQKSSDNPVDLFQYASQFLSETAEKLDFKIKPLDTEFLTFNGATNGYTLGDKVSIVVDGVSFSEIVRGVDITVDSDGEEVLPSIGTPKTNLNFLDRLFGSVRDVSKRLSVSERI